MEAAKISKMSISDLVMFRQDRARKFFERNYKKFELYTDRRNLSMNPIMCGHVMSSDMVDCPTPNLEKISTRADWSALCSNSKVPAEFFEANIGNVVWEAIMYHRMLPEWFVEKYLVPFNMSWELIARMLNLSVAFFDKYIAKFRNNRTALANLAANRSLPLEFFKRHEYIFGNLIGKLTQNTFDIINSGA
jgi:hypothetical protein